MTDAAAGFVVRTYAPGDEARIVRLWEECGLVVPWNDPRTDIALKVGFQPELFFVGEQDGRIVACVMAGFEGHRGWINYLAVSPDQRRRGLGRKMMTVAEEALRDLGCPKINLQVRANNQEVIDFYERVGFRVEQTVSLGKRLDGKTWH